MLDDRSHELALEVAEAICTTSQPLELILPQLRAQARHWLEDDPWMSDRAVRNGLRSFAASLSDDEGGATGQTKLELELERAEAFIPGEVFVDGVTLPLSATAREEILSLIQGALEHQISDGSWPGDPESARQRLSWLCRAQTQRVRRAIEKELARERAGSGWTQE